MRLVVDPKDDLGVENKATSELPPEFLELLGSGSVGVGNVTNDTSRERSIRGITADNVSKDLCCS